VQIAITAPVVAAWLESRGSGTAGTLTWLAGAVALLVTLFGAWPASAQALRPVPRVVLEVRGLTGGLPEDPTTAADLGFAADTLPDRAFGGAAGLHVYPVRRTGFALGLGGDGVLVRARAPIVDLEGVATGDRLVRQIQGLSGVVSLNFGHSDGWSHISAGAGPLRFKNASSGAGPGPGTENTSPYLLTLNAGGGARWFLSRHVAFMFDVRFYFTRPEAASLDSAGRQAQRLVLLSAGLAIK